MIANDTTFVWNLRREILAAFTNQGWETYLLAQIIEYQSEITSLGVQIFNINIDRRGTNPISDIKLFKQYKSVLNTLSPDVVFINNTKPNIYAGLACQKLNIRYISNITGLGTAVEIPGKLQWLSIRLYKCGVRKATTLFFQNQQNQDFFHQHKMVAEKTREILLPGSGVNLETHPLLPWPEGAIHFLYAARIMKEKGIDYFLSAARKYANENVVFDICGQCDDKRYEDLLKSEKSVEYHGLQKDLLPFYAKCSCFLYPSYYPEGMSNVLLEAAACGRPVIAADRAGCRETVENGESGFLIPVRDEDAVLNAVKMILDMTEEQRKGMGKRGREKMKREFDRKKVVKEYINEVQRICGINQTTNHQGEQI